jgi:hypothetical protein
VKSFWWGLVLAAVAGAGCLDSNLLHLGRQAPPSTSKDAPVKPLPPTPRAARAVTAEQVTTHNYQAKAQALREELDQEENLCPASAANCSGQACACGRH